MKYWDNDNITESHNSFISGSFSGVMTIIDRSIDERAEHPNWVLYESGSIWQSRGTLVVDSVSR